jgi:hypothetical protein
MVLHGGNKFSPQLTLSASLVRREIAVFSELYIRDSIKSLISRLVKEAVVCHFWMIFTK